MINIFLTYYNIFEGLNKLRNQAMAINTYQSYETINSRGLTHKLTAGFLKSSGDVVE